MKTWTIWILVFGEWIFDQTMKATCRKDVVAFVKPHHQLGTWKVREGDYSST